MINQEKLQRTVNQVIDLLVRKDYEALEELTRSRRLSAHEIELAVAQYGRRITYPSEGAECIRDLVEVRGASPSEWAAYVDLWTIEEGRSDLTLELRVFDGRDPVFRVEIDDLHVL